MSNNNRIFYACQGVAIGTEGLETYGTGNMVHGVQTIGMTTNFNLEQAFELGQIEIYENIEGTPEIEVTLEKLLDGYPLMYHLASQSAGADAGLVGRSKVKCDLRLGIFDESKNAIANTNVPEVEVYCSGLFISNISYTIPVDGNSTESITLVGNNKQWLTSSQKLNSNAYIAFSGGDTPLAYAPGSGGIQRREDVMMDRCIFPKSIKGVLNSTTYGNAVSGVTPLIHVQNVSISTDFAREDIFELGRKTPYYRPAGFPIEVTCEIEAISTSGDFVAALEVGDASLYGTASSGNNTSEETIYIETRCRYAWDLGRKNRLTSVSYGGGDAGGGNVSCTYSYSNYNVLDVQHSGVTHAASKFGQYAN